MCTRPKGKCEMNIDAAAPRQQQYAICINNNNINSWFVWLFSVWLIERRHEEENSIRSRVECRELTVESECARTRVSRSVYRNHTHCTFPIHLHGF